MHHCLLTVSVKCYTAYRVPSGLTTAYLCLPPVQEGCSNASSRLCTWTLMYLGGLPPWHISPTPLVPIGVPPRVHLTVRVDRNSTWCALSITSTGVHASQQIVCGGTTPPCCCKATLRILSHSILGPVSSLVTQCRVLAHTLNCVCRTCYRSDHNNRRHDYNSACYCPGSVSLVLGCCDNNSLG